MVMVLVLSAAGSAFAASPAKISKTKLTLTAGFSSALKVTGVKGKVSWKSSNPAVAKVSAAGKVTAVKAGSAVITARVNKTELKCKVTVKANTMKTTHTLSGVRPHGSGISFFPQRLTFDAKKNLVVKGFFTNSTLQFVRRLSNYHIRIYADGQLLADGWFNLNTAIPSGGHQYYTLTFTPDCCRRLDLRGVRNILVQEIGYYN